jgi:hypothetical protein
MWRGRRDRSDAGLQLDHWVGGDDDSRPVDHDDAAGSDHAEGAVRVQQRHPSKQWGRRRLGQQRRPE